MRTRRCARCKRNRQARFFTGPRGRVCVTCQRQRRSRAAHGRRVNELYGITPAEYERLFRSQAGACAICQGTRPYRLHVDHDHKVEKEKGARASVRGLLCKRCNSLLARVGDNPWLLRSAALYLEAPPTRGVIK